jgi:hypothetical protein
MEKGKEKRAHIKVKSSHPRERQLNYQRLKGNHPCCFFLFPLKHKESADEQLLHF